VNQYGKKIVDWYRANIGSRIATTLILNNDEILPGGYLRHDPSRVDVSLYNSGPANAKNFGRVKTVSHTTKVNVDHLTFNLKPDEYPEFSVGLREAATTLKLGVQFDGARTDPKSRGTQAWGGGEDLI